MAEDRPLGSEYDLTTDEFNRSLSRAEMGVFMRCNPSRTPHSVFVVAQPGAGKTGLKSYIINRGQVNGTLSSYVEFNPDDIGPYHEHYVEIMRKYPDESFPILQRFIRPALDGFLRQKAVDMRTNIVQEGTFASKAGYLEILNFQKNGGMAPIGRINEDGTREQKPVNGNYYIEVAALAVDRFNSLLSSYEREQFFRDNHMPPRIVQPKYHDDSYMKMLDTLDEVERLGLADRISVYRRGYYEDKPEIVWVSDDNRYRSAREAITVARNRDRIELMHNPEPYRERLSTLLSKAKDEEQVSRIKSLQDEFEQEYDKFYGRNNPTKQTD